MTEKSAISASEESSNTVPIRLHLAEDIMGLRFEFAPSIHNVLQDSLTVSGQNSINRDPQTMTHNNSYHHFASGEDDGGSTMRADSNLERNQAAAALKRTNLGDGNIMPKTKAKIILVTPKQPRKLESSGIKLEGSELS